MGGGVLLNCGLFDCIPENMQGNEGKACQVWRHIMYCLWTKKCNKRHFYNTWMCNKCRVDVSRHTKPAAHNSVPQGIHVEKRLNSKHSNQRNEKLTLEITYNIYRMACTNYLNNQISFECRAAHILLMA